MRRSVRFGVLSAVIGAALGGGGSALAATSAPAGGTVHIWVTFNLKSPNTQQILFTGAIGDYGTATNIDKNGHVDPNGNYVKVTLKQGTFVLDVATLNKKGNQASGTSNLATCSFWSVVTAPVTFGTGAGLYAGIRGTVQATESFAGVAGRYTSGPKKGKCKQTGEPLAAYGSVNAVGNISFG